MSRSLIYNRIVNIADLPSAVEARFPYPLIALKRSFISRAATAIAMEAAAEASAAVTSVSSSLGTR